MNHQIRSKEIRLIGPNAEQIGVVPTAEGIKLAQDNGLDLVEIAPNSNPPVCRVMDFSKYKYDQEKKEKEARKHQRLLHIKEVQFKPNIEENDYNVKVRSIEKFIKHGNKVKVALVFRGREMAHMDIGKALLDKLRKEIQPFAAIEKGEVLEGRTITMVVAPK